jgi:hypothetical protein
MRSKMSISAEDKRDLKQAASGTLIAYVAMFSVAWVLMLFWGSFAPRVGLPTFGYWTFYLGGISVQIISGIVFRPITYRLEMIRKALRGE